MSAVSQKVGKSLLKYFTPISLISQQKNKFNNKFSQNANSDAENAKKKELEAGLKRLLSEHNLPEELSDEILASPPKDTTNWVEMINYVLLLCKKTKDKFIRRAAPAAYRKAMESKTAGKIKYIGSMVNTNLDEAEDTFYIKRLEKEAEMDRIKERRRLQDEYEDKIREEEKKARDKKDKSAA